MITNGSDNSDHNNTTTNNNNSSALDPVLSMHAQEVCSPAHENLKP